MTHQKAVQAKVQISKDGSYLISGNLPLSKTIIGTNERGESIKWKQGQHYPAQEANR